MSKNRNNREIIDCDWCEATVPKGAIKDGGSAWKYGMRGEVHLFGTYCQIEGPETKHACANELCQAKLLVWART